METISSRLFQQPNQHRDSGRTWSLVVIGTRLVLLGAASLLAPKFLFIRMLELAMGNQQSFAGGMTALACVLAIVVVVLIDALLHLFSSFPLEGMSHALLLAGMGIDAIVVAIFLPDVTAYIAIILIAACAVLIGTLEVVNAVGYGNALKPRFLIAFNVLVLVALGVFTMVRVFAAAVIMLAGIAIAAIVGGTLLIARGWDARARKPPIVVQSVRSDRRAA